MNRYCLTLLVFAIALLTGSGCLLEEKIGWAWPAWPWGAESTGNAERNARAVPRASGLSFDLRPSLLGVTGVVEEVLGNEDRVVHATVRAVDAERYTRLEWTTTTASGTLELANYENAHAMLLPAFWPEGASRAEGNGGLWLSSEAYAELTEQGMTEWRLGLADRTVTTLEKAYATFSNLAARLSGAATSTGTIAPFRIEKVGVIDTFPLQIDRRVVLVRVIKATGWFADFFILANPDNPMILKTVIHPVAAPALEAFAGSTVRWNELGYEITSLRRP